MLENRDRKEGGKEGRWKEGRKEEREYQLYSKERARDLHLTFKFKLKVRVYLRSVLL